MVIIIISNEHNWLIFQLHMYIVIRFTHTYSVPALIISITGHVMLLALTTQVMSVVSALAVLPLGIIVITLLVVITTPNT